MLFDKAEGVSSSGVRSRGRRRGTRNKERLREPAEMGPVRARARATSLSVALENHLNPLIVYTGP